MSLIKHILNAIHNLYQTTSTNKPFKIYFSLGQISFSMVFLFLSLDQRRKHIILTLLIPILNLSSIVNNYPFRWTQGMKSSFELQTRLEIFSLHLDTFIIIHIILPAILGLFVREIKNTWFWLGKRASNPGVLSATNCSRSSSASTTGCGGGGAGLAATVILKKLAKGYLKYPDICKKAS